MRAVGKFHVHSMGPSCVVAAVGQGPHRSVYAVSGCHPVAHLGQNIVQDVLGYIGDRRGHVL